MKFVVDECAGPAVAAWLSQAGHDVVSIYDECPGADDDAILNRAHSEERIVVTADKDFGEMVFREGRPHRGVILLRFHDQSPPRHISALGELLQNHAASLPDRFVVVTDAGVRIVEP